MAIVGPFSHKDMEIMKMYRSSISYMKEDFLRYRDAIEKEERILQDMMHKCA